MNRKTITRIGAYVMILSLVLTIFIGAMSVKAATIAPSSSPSNSAASNSTPNPDIDGDGITNNEDPDMDGDGIDNGVDPDIDGDGIPNAQDPNPTSTNNVDGTPVKVANDQNDALGWLGGIGVLAVLGWLVALPILRRRRGTATKR
jgi:hypothetical protein